MKDEIKRFLIAEGKKLARQKLQEVASDPVGFFTPHHEKITRLAFFGRNGEWRVSKGSVRPALASRIFAICKEGGVVDGWIALKSEGGRTWVDCSSTFKESDQQRIRNAMTAE